MAKIYQGKSLVVGDVTKDYVDTSLDSKQDKLTVGDNINIQMVYPDSISPANQKWDTSTQTFIPMTNEEIISGYTPSSNSNTLVKLFDNINTTRSYSFETYLKFGENNPSVGFGISTYGTESILSSNYLRAGIYNITQIEFQLRRNGNNDLATTILDINPTVEEGIYIKFDANHTTKLIKCFYKLQITDQWIEALSYTDTSQIFFTSTDASLYQGLISTSDSVVPPIIYVNRAVFEYTPARPGYLEISAIVPDISTLATKTELQTDLNTLQNNIIDPIPYGSLLKDEWRKIVIDGTSITIPIGTKFNNWTTTVEHTTSITSTNKEELVVVYNKNGTENVAVIGYNQIVPYNITLQTYPYFQVRGGLVYIVESAESSSPAYLNDIGLVAFNQTIVGNGIVLDSNLIPISHTYSVEYGINVYDLCINSIANKVESNTKALDGIKLKVLTQSEYDAIVDKDPTTLYLING